MDTPIKAVIDLGTNTFNLLIGKVSNEKLEILHADKKGVGLGLGGVHKGILADDAIERALVTLKEYCNTCATYQCEDIQMIGTSAIRDAKNKTSFIEKIQKETGITVSVISGIQEAEYIYKGVAYSCEEVKDGLIMDIGGGSTEFIQVKENKVNWSASFDIGVSRIYQELCFQDPMSKQDIQNIYHYLNLKTERQLPDSKITCLIGSSGTFETLYELIHQHPFPKGLDVVHIEIELLKQVCNSLISSTQAERDLNNWIIPIRKKMAPIAAVQIIWLMERFQFKTCVVSSTSLKEGVLLE